MDLRTVFAETVFNMIVKFQVQLEPTHNIQIHFGNEQASNHAYPLAYDFMSRFAVMFFRKFLKMCLFQIRFVIFFVFFVTR